MTPTGTAVRLERTIPAPPAAVYRAWLDPDTMRRWFAPVGWSAARVEVDERPGGHHRVWMNTPDGQDAGGAEARIVELVPDERIVLDWWFVGPDRDTDPEQVTRLTITLRPAGDGTHLTLVHDRLDGLAAAMPEAAAGVEEGWTGTLGLLADTLRGAARPTA